MFSSHNEIIFLIHINVYFEGMYMLIFSNLLYKFTKCLMKIWKINEGIQIYIYIYIYLYILGIYVVEFVAIKWLHSTEGHVHTRRVS